MGSILFFSIVIDHLNYSNAHCTLFFTHLFSLEIIALCALILIFVNYASLIFTSLNTKLHENLTVS